MRYLIYLVAIAALIPLLGILYVRLSPSVESRWHLPIKGTENADFNSGAVRVISGDRATLDKIDAIMAALPRTRILAGSVEEDRITYITRTKWVGFPDYTTIEHADGMIKMYARSRFGPSDLGVNRNRLERVLNAIE